MHVNIERADFVAVPSTDWERSRAFYVETLGLRADERARAEFWVGDQCFAIWEPERVGGTFEPQRNGHIAFHVDDVEATRTDLAAKGATGSKSKVVCDALIIDEESRSDTYPYIRIDENDVDIGHEATVTKVGEEQLFYLMSRGLSESEASAMIVSGFVEPIVKELPLEYAVELNRLIQLQMEGSVG